MGNQQSGKLKAGGLTLPNLTRIAGEDERFQIKAIRVRRISANENSQKCSLHYDRIDIKTIEDLRNLIYSPLGCKYLLSFETSMKMEPIILLLISLQHILAIPDESFLRSLAKKLPKSIKQIKSLPVDNVLKFKEKIKDQPDFQSMSSTLKELESQLLQVYMEQHYVKFRLSKYYDDYVDELSRNPMYLHEESFQYGSILGRGAFGYCVHVRKKSTNTEYAMKIQSKNGIASLFSKDLSLCMLEKKIMSLFVSPFLVNVHYALQTDRHALLVMDFVEGNSLDSYIKSLDEQMEEEQAAFYIAEILLGLEDLHKHRIIHRDIKPENVVIASTGHIKVLDMGLAMPLEDCVEIEEKVYMKDQWKGGTLEYMAPEIHEDVMNKTKTSDYGCAVDVWAVGVTLFELLAGYIPFDHTFSESQDEQDMENVRRHLSSGGLPPIMGNPGIDDPFCNDARLGSLTNDLLNCGGPLDPTDLNRKLLSPRVGVKRTSSNFFKIHHKKLDYPENFSENAKSLINSCLRLNPTDRITIEQAKRHPFFQKIDWKRLRSSASGCDTSVKPPHIPQKKEIHKFQCKYRGYGGLMDEILRDIHQRQTRKEIKEGLEADKVNLVDLWEGKVMEETQQVFEEWDFLSKVAMCHERKQHIEHDNLPIPRKATLITGETGSTSGRGNGRRSSKVRRSSGADCLDQIPPIKANFKLQ